MALSVTRHAPRNAAGRWWLVAGETRPALSVEAAAAARWELLRGQELAHFAVDLFGGFPGAAQMGGRAGALRLSVSDRYLTANDGARDGFALPLSALRGMSLLPSPVPGDPAVRVRYRLDGVERTMILRIHHRRTRTLRRQGQVERFLRVLDERGVPPLAPIDPGQRRRLAVSWDEARAFSGETMVWNGEASAPVGGWLGQGRAPCRAWLTTRALYWGMPTGHGINRLALTEIETALTAEMDDRGESPVVVIAMRDLAGDRLELPFVFDQPAAGINQRDRGAFAIGLRSQEIEVVAAPARPQPWTAAAHAAGPPALSPDIAPPSLPEDVHDLAEMVVTLA